MGVINLAHGSFYMIGAYMAFASRRCSATSSSLMLVAGVVLAAIFGYVLEWAFFSYLYQRDHLQQVLMTYGADPGVRGAAQHPGRQRRARRQGAALAVRQLRARRPDDLPGGTACSPRRPASCWPSGCTGWSTARGWA
jgi:branched-subunit amino acid ABC-type transport system permease component